MLLSMYPIGILFLAYVLLYLLSCTQGEFDFEVSTLVCWIPGMESTRVCYQLPSGLPKYAELLQVESLAFEQLLSNAAGGVSLSLKIKKAEMATADLAVLVAHGNLEGRGTLLEHLRCFLNTAKAAGRGLSRLESQIYGAIDSIIAINDYAPHTIETSARKGLATQRIAGKLFSDTISVLSSHTTRIVVEAERSMKHLDELEQMLTTLRDGLQSVGSTLLDLRRISWYCRSTRAHVKATLVALDTMRKGVEDLHERATAPGPLGETVSVDVLLQGIRAGLDRLVATRSDAQQRGENVFRDFLDDNSDFEGKLELGM